MREVTFTSRLTLTSMRSMHINLPVLPLLKVEELMLSLGTNKLLSVLPWTYHSWMLNSLKL